ncbi:MAG: hypothetical protein SOY13_01415 [Pseudoflavonifractor sp.]|nr:hypothetical protein [Pseudoflavonifractor sp.]
MIFLFSCTRAAVRAVWRVPGVLTEGKTLMPGGFIPPEQMKG